MHGSGGDCRDIVGIGTTSTPEEQPGCGHPSIYVSRVEMKRFESSPRRLNLTPLLMVLRGAVSWVACHTGTAH